MDDELRLRFEALEAQARRQWKAIETNTRAVQALTLEKSVAEAVASRISKRSERRVALFGRFSAVLVSVCAVASLLVTVWYHV